MLADPRPAPLAPVDVQQLRTGFGFAIVLKSHGPHASDHELPQGRHSQCFVLFDDMDQVGARIRRQAQVLHQLGHVALPDRLRLGKILGDTSIHWHPPRQKPPDLYRAGCKLAG